MNPRELVQNPQIKGINNSRQTSHVVVVAFSMVARILEDCSTVHSPSSLLFVGLLVFEVEISSRTLISLFMTGSVYSGSASRGDCGRMFSAVTCITIETTGARIAYCNFHLTCE